MGGRHLSIFYCWFGFWLLFFFPSDIKVYGCIPCLNAVVLWIREETVKLLYFIPGMFRSMSKRESVGELLICVTIDEQITSRSKILRSSSVIKKN